MRNTNYKQNVHGIPLVNSGCRLCWSLLTAVIARSACDEAIHGAACGPMDCFAELAMTADRVVIISRGLRVLSEPGAHPRVGIGMLRHVADHRDGVGAGGEN